MLEKQCHYTLTLFGMLYYNMPRVQTRCRAQDCKENAASLKSCPWMSPCSCETVQTVNHFSVIKTHFTTADKLKQHGSPGLLHDLQVSQLATEATGAPHRLLTLGYSWTEAGRHKDSSARASLEPSVGARSNCTKCFGSRSLATNTTFPGHMAAVCAQPVTLTRAHGPWWLHSYPRARTAREIGLPVLKNQHGITRMASKHRCNYALRKTFTVGILQ